LDLQTVMKQAYANGAYEDTTDHTLPPEPPLGGAAAEWAKELLRNHNADK
jgi:hypothetical protein